MPGPASAPSKAGQILRPSALQETHSWLLRCIAYPYSLSTNAGSCIHWMLLSTSLPTVVPGSMLPAASPLFTPGGILLCPLCQGIYTMIPQQCWCPAPHRLPPPQPQALLFLFSITDTHRPGTDAHSDDWENTGQTSRWTKRAQNHRNCKRETRTRGGKTQAMRGRQAQHNLNSQDHVLRL